MRRILIALLASYLLGSISFSYFLGKIIKKVDIRDLGTNNAGATNAFNELGIMAGVITAVCDMLKGLIAVSISSLMFGIDVNMQALCGLFAIVGHIYPFYLGFRGGKGLATIIGVSLGIGFWFGLIAFITLVIVSAVTDYLPIGTAAVCICCFVMVYAKYKACWASLIFAAIAVVMIIKHIPNFVRIYNKQEKSVSSALKGAGKKAS
ncbi:MAG: glycerol-3-phosphate 1-O-acyltransferase PlsY [Eubacteriaceae bacterium]|jgi:glycerol-3-phosphate acyltransferase PlsY|nr:glycerol-3-phosphate 1-O-acyltransferase PlsY [Eubacteriaceae bacterium]